MAPANQQRINVGHGINGCRPVAVDHVAVKRRCLRLLLMLPVLLSFHWRSFAASGVHWTSTWGSSMQRAAGTDALPPHALDGATLRQVVHTSIAGRALRLHLSNAFGESPLVLRSVRIGIVGRAEHNPAATAAQTQVLFNSQPSISIPAGAEYYSDTIAVASAPLSDVVITITIGSAPDNLTIHSGSRATSYLQTAGATQETAVAHWYFLAGLEVGASASAVVTLGDSITDGHGATVDANDRWPDVLARRLAAKQIGVVNAGIGGNCILSSCLGPNALARFDRDVLVPAGVHSLIVLEGINDLGGLDRLDEHSQQAHNVLVEQLEAALLQIAQRAHTHGIRIFVGTISPDGGSVYYHPSARSEADRQAVNQWIRTSGAFDDVIDFDVLLRDPLHPDRLAAAYDSGDHLHPSPAGYKRMGEAVPLSLFHS